MEDSKKSNSATACIVLFIIYCLTVAIMLYIIFGIKNNCQSTQENNNTQQVTTEETKTTESQSTDTSTKKVVIVKEKDDEGKGEISIDSNKNLIIDNEIIDTNIRSYIYAEGFSDICAGNSYYVFLKEDGTVSALSRDDLDCTKIITYKKNISNITNAKAIYNDIYYTDDDNNLTYPFTKISVKTSTSETIDITNSVYQN